MAETPNNSSTADGLKAHACVLCQRRKVKCDRRQPCATCAKAWLVCEYREPLPPRRRKKKDSEASLAARVRHYEHALQKAGIDVSSIDAENPLRMSAGNTREAEIIHNTPVSRDNHSITSTENSPGQGPGRLVSRKGRSLYLDKCVKSFKLWFSHMLTYLIAICGKVLAMNFKTPTTYSQRMSRKNLQNLEFKMEKNSIAVSYSEVENHVKPSQISIQIQYRSFNYGIRFLTVLIH